jgi:uncharacterized RDD family membrane protein YckC
MGDVREDGVWRSATGWLERRRAQQAYGARLAEHEGAMRAWQAEAARLDEALRVVEAGGVDPAPDSGVRLRTGERLQYEIRGVQLVETRTRPAETTSRHAEVGLRSPVSVGVGVNRTRAELPVDDSTVLDVGRVVITDTRVAFAGQKHAREWRFDELLSVECSNDQDAVFLPLNSRPETSGFRYRHELHWRVTSRLEIGLARHCQDWKVVEGWRRRREELERAQPRPPVAPPGARAPARPRPSRPSSSPKVRGHPGAGARSRPRPAWGLVGRRAAARVVDLLLLSVVFGLLAPLFPMTGTGTAAAAAIALVACEARPVRRRGRSFGKRVVGLVVVDAATGRTPGGWRSLFRTALLGVLTATLVGPLVELYRLVTGRTETAIHDQLAGTDVMVV